MEEISNIFLGHYNIVIWLGTLFWSAFIIFAYKLFHAPNKENGFTWRYFWNDNTRGLLLNLIISIVLLRMGHDAIHSVYDWINGKFADTPILDPDSMDVVILVALISTPISIFLHHKWKKPISKEVEKEMHVHNANCGHKID